MKVLLVPKQQLNSVWERVGDVIAHERVLNNWNTKESLYARLVNDQSDLWVSSTLKSALIGGIFTRLNGDKTYVVDFMSSIEGCQDWTQAIEAIEANAKDQGCSSIQIRGRKGWQKLFKEYNTIQVTLERKL